MKKQRLIFLLALLFSSLLSSQVLAYNSSSYNKTIGGMILGNIQLIDSAPNLDLGIGGGMYFDYRFNEKFSITLDAFFTTQDGDGANAAEGSIEFLGIPTSTFKLYLLGSEARWDPYFGIGVGFYALTEGDVNNATDGYGMGAQVEVGFDYYLTDNLALGTGGTFRTAGLINSLSGNGNATAYIPYTLFGRIGYRF